jgi:hypothetical protein
MEKGPDRYNRIAPMIRFVKPESRNSGIPYRVVGTDRIVVKRKKFNNALGGKAPNATAGSEQRVVG